MKKLIFAAVIAIGGIAALSAQEPCNPVPCQPAPCDTIPCPQAPCDTVCTPVPCNPGC